MTEAIAHYTQAIKNNPADQESYYNLATIYGQQKKWAQALHYFAELININPHHEKALLNFAIVATEIEDWEKVYHTTKHLLKLTNNKIHQLKAHILIAQAIKELGNNLLAIEHFEQALIIDPQQIEAKYHLGLLYLAEQRLDDAEKLLKNINLYGENLQELYFNLAVLYHKKHDLKQAQIYYLKALEIDKNNFNAYYNLGSIYQKQHQLELALDYYKKAQQIDETNQNLNFLIAALTGNYAVIPPGFVQTLFDNYADHFDDELSKQLKYQTPQQLYQFFIDNIENGPQSKFDILDLGCGTGLSGLPFVKLKNTMIGVDLSPKMLTKAKEKNIYDQLVCADVLEFLQNNTRHSLLLRHPENLLIACDTLVYFGDLMPFFLGCLNFYNHYDNGITLISVELCDDQHDFILTQNCRYAHSAKYIQQIAHQLGLILKTQETIIRYNAGLPVQGLLVMIKKDLAA